MRFFKIRTYSNLNVEKSNTKLINAHALKQNVRKATEKLYGIPVSNENLSAKSNENVHEVEIK